MNLLRKLGRLNRAEQALLIRAGVLVAAIRVTLWVVSWYSLIRILDRQVKPARPQVFSAERLAWAVHQVSRVVPRATCLTQALALHHLLVRFGYPSSVQIGVTKTAEKGFQAHAWVEHKGSALLNRPEEIARYAHLHTVKSSK